MIETRPWLTSLSTRKVPGVIVCDGFGTGGAASPLNGQFARSLSSFAAISAFLKSPAAAMSIFFGSTHLRWNATRSSRVNPSTEALVSKRFR